MLKFILRTISCCLNILVSIKRLMNVKQGLEINMTQLKLVNHTFNRLKLIYFKSLTCVTFAICLSKNHNLDYVYYMCPNFLQLFCLLHSFRYLTYYPFNVPVVGDQVLS